VSMLMVALVEVGYRPELHHDVADRGSPLPDAPTFAFSSRLGGLTQDPGADAERLGLWRIRAETVAVLRAAERGDRATLLAAPRPAAPNRSSPRPTTATRRCLQDSRSNAPCSSSPTREARSGTLFRRDDGQVAPHDSPSRMRGTRSPGPMTSALAGGVEGRGPRIWPSANPGMGEDTLLRP
jgi:hypothetical protein